MRPLVTLVALMILAAPAAAQTTETPVPFDTAGRILSVNPPLAGRLGLTQPAWPVTGAFVEARLYQLSTGGYTLTVTRSGGAVDRFALTDAQATALRTEFAQGIGRAGRVVAEDAASVIAEPARGPFVRDQMLLASIIYGPSLATLTDDGSLGTGVYMLSVGGTFFGINEFARTRSVTKAQNSLTTDGALRGWAATALASNMLGADLSENGAALTALIGGVGGSMVGFNRGRNLTNSEAQAAMTGSTLAAGALLGLGVTTGLIGEDNDEDGRLASGAILAGGIAGYIAGPGYPRRAGYTVTAGDVQVVRLGSLLGTLAAITPFVEADVGIKGAAGLMTAGWVGGALIADRVGTRPFNHSTSDTRMIYLGALGGALMGSALPIMSQTENGVFIMTTITGGAILGTVVTQRMMDPAREGSMMRNSGSSANNGPRFELRPEAALLAATGKSGNHTLLKIRF